MICMFICLWDDRLELTKSEHLYEQCSGMKREMHIEIDRKHAAKR
jgi:hypothetical protein